MNQVIIQQLSEIVERACLSSSNVYGAEIWQNHILPVMMYGDALAIEQGADREIVAISALLHDYAAIYNAKYYDDHHIHSAKIARYLLEQFNYPKARIERVVNAILSHRASVELPKRSLEAEVLVNADAMAHISEYQSLLDYAHNHKKLTWPRSYQFVLHKLERSFNKANKRVQKLLTKRYYAIKRQLQVAS